MDKNIAEESLKLLNSKVECLTKMLRLTEEFNKTCEKKPEDSEAYILLTEKRKTLFDRVVVIDNKLKEAGVDVDEIAGDIGKKVKDLASKFIEADKAATIIAKDICSGLSSSIKNINNGKAATQLYNDVRILNTTQFDKSN